MKLKVTEETWDEFGADLVQVSYNCSAIPKPNPISRVMQLICTSPLVCLMHDPAIMDKATTTTLILKEVHFHREDRFT